MPNMEKSALLIDAHSLSNTTNKLGMTVDFRRLKLYLAKNTKITAAKYYALVDADNLDNPYIKLLDWLEYNGYRVHRKSARSTENERGIRSIKGSVLTDLSVDLVLLAKHVDHIILVSGRSDLTYPVAQAQRIGAKVSLLGSLQADGFRPADELRRTVDNFIELNHLREEISKASRD